jgi:hypothetical protein
VQERMPAADADRLKHPANRPFPIHHHQDLPLRGNAVIQVRESLFPMGSPPAFLMPSQHVSRHWKSVPASHDAEREYRPALAHVRRIQHTSHQSMSMPPETHDPLHHGRTAQGTSRSLRVVLRVQRPLSHALTYRVFLLFQYKRKQSMDVAPSRRSREPGPTRAVCSHGQRPLTPRVTTAILNLGKVCSFSCC